MADWQIKGLVLLGAALAGLTLAASASAAWRPEQVAADQLSCATIAGSGDGVYQAGGVLACCLGWTPQADA